MSSEAYMRGFTKVAEANGVDPVGLAKYAGSGIGRVADKASGALVKRLFETGILTRGSKPSIWKKFMDLIKYRGKTPKLRSSDMATGESRINQKYLEGVYGPQVIRESIESSNPRLGPFKVDLGNAGKEPITPFSQALQGVMLGAAK